MSTRNGLAERDSRTSHNTFHAASQSTRCGYPSHSVRCAPCTPPQHLPQHILHSAPHALFKRRSSALHWQPYTLQTLHPTLQNLYTSYTLLNARRNPDAGPPNSTLRATNSRPYYAPCSTLPTLPRTLYTLTPSHPGLQTPHFTRYTAKLFIPQASPASNSTLAPDAPDLPDRGMGGVILTGGGGDVVLKGGEVVV